MFFFNFLRKKVQLQVKLLLKNNTDYKTLSVIAITLKSSWTSLISLKNLRSRFQSFIERKALHSKMFSSRSEFQWHLPGSSRSPLRDQFSLYSTPKFANLFERFQQNANDSNGHVRKTVTPPREYINKVLSNSAVQSV